MIEQKLDALVDMESQFVEGGAQRLRDPLPDNDPAEREARAAAGARALRDALRRTADHYRDKLIELYGEEQGKKVRYAEAFEICEYGRRPNAAELRRAVPVLPEEELNRTAKTLPCCRRGRASVAQ